MATCPVHHADSLGVTAPVLSVVGNGDGLFCPVTGCSSIPGLGAIERTLWPQAPSFGFKIVPEAGHDLNLQLNSHVFFDAAQRWMDARF